MRRMFDPENIIDDGVMYVVPFPPIEQLARAVEYETIFFSI